MLLLTNKDCHRDIYKEIFNKIVKERFDGELTNETHRNYLRYCFKGHTAEKRYDGCNNRKELFKKIWSGEMNL